MMEVWIGRQGERHGPYQEDQVRQWLRSGELSRDDLGWYDGLADWQPLSVLFADEMGSTVPPAFSTTTTATAAQPYGLAYAVSYAGFWKRLLAYIIDAIVLWIPSVAIQKMMGGDVADEAMKQAQLASPSDPQVLLTAMNHYYAAMSPAMLVLTVITWLYFAICESSPWQATPGKLALGIRVTDLQGNRISLPHALGRYAGKFLSAFILLIGFLMAAFTERKQALHDLIANTLVVNGRANDIANAAPPPGRNDSSSFHA
jgi:uncharacterized RDD family membrane protein YckC